MNTEIDKLSSDPEMDRLLREKKPASSGTGVAILALLVAMAAVLATGWQWWQTRTAVPDEDSQKAAISQLQESQQNLSASLNTIEKRLANAHSPVDAAELSRREERLKAVETQLGGLLDKVGQDESSISAVQGSMRSMEQRISTAESGLVSVAAASQQSSVALDIAEIDFLLRAASERLQLFSDPVAADMALQAADVQIEALNDPMFLSVRQRIAEARKALAMVPTIDSVKLAARITDLQSRINSLPFRGEVEEHMKPPLPDNAGWWESFKHTLSSLVTVRRRVPEEQPALSLEDKDYLRQGLWLQLESARLALMRKDNSIYQSSLDRVDATVRQFFKNGSSEVQAVLLETAGLEQVNVAPAMPDISAPWTQLRQLRDSRRLLQSAKPVENPETDNPENRQ